MAKTNCTNLSLAVLKVLITITLTIVSFVSNAATIYVLDFDGTIVSDAAKESSWKTPWVLVKVNQLHSISQTSFIKDTPDRIELSYGEYRALLPRLAKGDALLGDLEEVRLFNDPFLNRPSSIRPGLYKVNPDITFQFYKTNPDSKGQSHLLTHYLQANERAQKGAAKKDAWQGPAFALLRKALSETSDQSRILISTARDQSQAEFLQLFGRMESDGYLKSAEELVVGTNKVIIRSLESLSEGLELGRSLSERKVNSVVETAQQLLISPLKPHHEGPTTDAQSNPIEPKHTLIVAEDHPGYVSKIGQKLAELSREFRFKDSIRFVLLNAGVESDLIGARWGNRWTVFEEGFARDATEEEIRNWTRAPRVNSNQKLEERLTSSTSHAPKSCRYFLAAKKGK